MIRATHTMLMLFLPILLAAAPARDPAAARKDLDAAVIACVARHRQTPEARAARDAVDRAAQRVAAAKAAQASGNEVFIAEAAASKAMRKMVELEWAATLADPAIAAAEVRLIEAEKARPRPQPKRIVYVLDGSGSMLNWFGMVRAAARASIERLTPAHQFNIVMARTRLQGNQNEPPIFGGKLLPATPQNQNMAFSALDAFKVHGSDGLLPALAMALQLRPDAIWLVTDGDAGTYEATEQLLQQLRALNRARIPINTVLYLAGTSNEHIGLKLQHRSFLYTLAAETGGICLDESGKALLRAPGPPPVDYRPEKSEKPMMLERPADQ